MDVLKANDIIKLFAENMTFKKLFQRILTKISGGIEPRICGLKDQCLRPLSYDDIQVIRMQFHKISVFKLPYCDVDS